MTEREVTKNKIKNFTCEYCVERCALYFKDGNVIEDEWCPHKKKRPKEDTCENYLDCLE